MQTKLKANLAVAFSVCGSLMTMPYVEGSAAAAVLHHGFLAATIGGLADWFAVKAIFGKPLGIGYRTDILRNNRKRIMQGLIDFSASDLLRPENIMATLAKEDFAELFIKYLKVRGGMLKVKNLAAELLRAVLQSFDAKQLAENMEPCLHIMAEGIKTDKCFSEGLQNFTAQNLKNNITEQLFLLLERVLKNQNTQAVLEKYISNILQEYEAGGLGRGFMLSSMGLTSDKVLLKLNEQSLKWLADNKREDSIIYQRLNTGIENFLLSLAKNEVVLDRLQVWKAEKWENFNVKIYLQKWIEDYIAVNEIKWRNDVCALPEAYLAEFVESKERRMHFNRMVLHWIEKSLYQHKEIIPLIMQEQLERFSDDELVRLAESKVEEDLQMIRINGAIVGAIAGMVLYSLSCMVLRGLSI